MTSELWVDGNGKHVEVHERNDECVEHGCLHIYHRTTT